MRTNTQCEYRDQSDKNDQSYHVGRSVYHRLKINFVQEEDHREAFHPFTHDRRLYVSQDLSRSDFLDIKLSMDATDGNRNMFYSGGDFIILGDTNSGMYILQATDRFKKYNTKKF